MACCLVGSLLMLVGTAALRAFRRRVLRRAEPEPEQWRLFSSRSEPPA